AEDLIGKIMQDPSLLKALSAGPGAASDVDAALASLKPAEADGQEASDATEEVLDGLRASAPETGPAPDRLGAVLDDVRSRAPDETEGDASAPDALDSLRGSIPESEKAEDGGDQVLEALRSGAPAEEDTGDDGGAVLEALAGNAPEDTAQDDGADDVLEALRDAAPEEEEAADAALAGLEALREAAPAEPAAEDAAGDVLDGLRASAPREDTVADDGEDVLDTLKTGRAEEGPAADDADEILGAPASMDAGGGKAGRDAVEDALDELPEAAAEEDPPAGAEDAVDMPEALGEPGDGAESGESDESDQVPPQADAGGESQMAEPPEGGPESSADLTGPDDGALAGEADVGTQADPADDLEALLSMDLEPDEGDAGEGDDGESDGAGGPDDADLDALLADMEEETPPAVAEPDPPGELLQDEPEDAEHAVSDEGAPEAATPDPLDELLADALDEVEETPPEHVPASELAQDAPQDAEGREEAGTARSEPAEARETHAGPAAGASSGGRVGLSFGMLTAPRPAPRADPGAKFRMAVLGDFSGRAAKGEFGIGEDLRNRRPIKFDIDTAEDIIEGFATTLVLPVGREGAGIEVRLGGLDDLHPDELYENVEIFSELSGLRQRLRMESMAPAAVAELQEWGVDFGDDVLARHRRSAANAVPPDRTLSDFQALIGDTAGRRREPSPVSDLIARVVAPHVVQAPSAETGAMMAAIDESLSGAMRLILHHPEFQALEAQWRSLDLLARRVETDETLEIVLHDVSAEEIAADLATADDLAQSGLYGLLSEAVEERGEPGFSAVFGLYTFEETPPHAELLARIARVAAHTGAPFFASISPDFLKTAKADRHPLVADAWDRLRALPEAKYLGIATPRFLLRRPYGARSEPIDSFAFEEFTEAEGLKGMLWANPVALVAIVMAQTWKRTGREMRLGEVMSIGDIPFHYVTDRHGDQVALPCTERNLTTSKTEQAVTRGFMPVISIRGRDEIRLGSFQALGGGEIRGPWSPAESAPPPAAPPPHPEADVPPEPEGDLAGVSDQTGDEDAPADDGDDLDALLASFGEDGDDTDPEAMDPDLAALLEDL
ncbi:MAG: type VI secretion system contractile sheath domain-containing protein, partial [Paracoccaceae bacterium]